MRQHHHQPIVPNKCLCIYPIDLQRPTRRGTCTQTQEDFRIWTISMTDRKRPIFLVSPLPTYVPRMLPFCHLPSTHQPLCLRWEGNYQRNGNKVFCAFGEYWCDGSLYESTYVLQMVTLGSRVPDEVCILISGFQVKRIVFHHAHGLHLISFRPE